MSVLPANTANPLKVAYIISRFPTTSETFILYEILELERQGTPVELFSLTRHPEAVDHPGAQSLDARATYGRRVWSRDVWGSQWHWLLRRPRAYLATWARVLWETCGSFKHLSRALIVVPVAAGWARRIERLRLVHVHAHWATHPALAAYVIHRLTGLPYSFTAHADDIYLNQSMLGEKLARARFVVSISEYNRDFLRTRYGAAAGAKVAVIHCGVDPEVFKPRRRPDNERWTLICVGRLSEKKGQALLVQACAQLKSEGIALRCWLVGDGEDRRALAAVIKRLNLEAEVELLGPQPRPRVVDLLSQADVAVLPSITTAEGRMEGIAVALIEGAAMALPVVSTDSGGTPELVLDGVTGLLVPEGDVEALAGALRALHADPAAATRMGAAGRAKVMNEFNLSTNVARLRALYHDTGAPAVPSATHCESVAAR